MVTRVLAVLMMCFATVASAQGDWTAFGKFPYPSWHKQDSKIYSRYDEVKSGKVTTREWIPQGETDRTWTKRFWISDAPGAPVSPATALKRQILSFAKDCTKAQFHDENLRRGAAMAFVLCERHKKTGKGHFMVIWIGKRDGTIYIQREEWRGKAYDLDQDGGRFFTPAQLSSIVRAFRQTSLR